MVFRFQTFFSIYVHSLHLIFNLFKYSHLLLNRFRKSLNKNILIILLRLIKVVKTIYF